MKTVSPQLAPHVCELAEEAGRAILKFFRKGDWSVTAKADDSPVTQADLASNKIITEALEKLALAPVISEENDPQSKRVSDRYWLVDPLDGTKEFIAGRETFVVSIGLIENGFPIFGVIHAPVLNETFWAVKGNGAHGPRGRLFNQSQRTALIAAGSRSLQLEELAHLDLPIADVQKIGSALKFCRLASGDIDLYPRFGPTGEWDTAAGQILCEEAGCEVLDLSTGERLRYGKPQFLNSHGFFASRRGLK